MSLADMLTLFLAASAALAALIFVLAYAFRSPWWKNEVGANTMTLMIVIAVMVTLTFIFRITGYHASEWLGVVLWGILNVPLWWRFVILWRAQHGTLVSLQSPGEDEKE